MQLDLTGLTGQLVSVDIPRDEDGDSVRGREAPGRDGGDG